MMRSPVTQVRAQPEESPWRENGLDGHLVSLVDPTSFAADQYRTLRYVLEQLHATKRVIAVTSPIAGGGETTTALHLAGALARAPEARTVAVDLGVPTPSRAHTLRLTARCPWRAVRTP